MTAALTSPHLVRILEALQFQERCNDCGPYTTAMVVNALCGRNIEAAQLAEVMNKPRRKGLSVIIRRIPNWATFPWGMVDVFRANGLNASWRFRAQTDYLREVIEQGHILMPIVGSWRPLWAHVMTLLAWDPKKGWGFANTQFPQREITWVKDLKFKKQWRSMGYLLVEVFHHGKYGFITS